jgi:hydroxymethylbilane synthase
LSKTIIIGTRGSDLALWQANHVKSLLEAAGHACELHIIKTKGDNIQHLSFDKIEGKGFFTKEIEEALLNKEVDIAVHSHKDLETNQPDGLCIAAVSPRADERELLLILPHAVDENEPLSLKKNAIVGTSSARRKAQMLHHKPDIELKDIRGNVPTRIQKLRDGQFDAILLAKAGVDRLGLNLDGLHAVALNLETFVPAPAQGALALQCRSNDEEIIRILSEINDAPTQELLKVERTVLNRLNGGCQLPLGVHAHRTGNNITAHVAMAKTWNAPLTKFTMSDENADALIEKIMERLEQL